MIGVISLPLGSVLTGQPEIIGSSVLSAAASSVSFQFPTVYRAVMISGWVKATLSSYLYYRLNNDSGANYSMQCWAASAGVSSATRLTGEVFMYSNQNVSGINGVWAVDAVIIKSSASTRAEMVEMRAGVPTNIEVGGFGGEWDNTTDLLNRIDVSPSGGNFAAKSAITLWGYRL